MSAVVLLKRHRAWSELVGRWYCPVCGKDASADWYIMCWEHWYALENKRSGLTAIANAWRERHNHNNDK